MALCLVVLQFRSPPWAVRHKAPNILEGAYIPFDGPLSFAAYYLNGLQAIADWRIKYLEDTLTTPIKNMPSAFRASYMLPAQQESASAIHFWTPYETQVRIQLQGTRASLSQVTAAAAPQVPLSMKINKRNDLEKILSWREMADNNISRDNRNALQDRSSIDSSRGPYKNVTLSVDVKSSYLLWVSIVETNSKTLLENSLRILEQFGIGKKRHAGWGDLQKAAVYELQSSRQNLPSLDWKSLIYTIDGDAYIETLRLLSTREVSQIIKSGYLPLDMKFTQGAEYPPYWRKETVVEHARLLKR
jgi:hypothetical protein